MHLCVRFVFEYIYYICWVHIIHLVNWLHSLIIINMPSFFFSFFDFFSAVLSLMVEFLCDSLYGMFADVPFSHRHTPRSSWHINQLTVTVLLLLINDTVDIYHIQNRYTFRHTQRYALNRFILGEFSGCLFSIFCYIKNFQIIELRAVFFLFLFICMHMDNVNFVPNIHKAYG